MYIDRNNKKMSTIIDYIKGIQILKSNPEKQIEHSNEFSIESEKTNTSISTKKIKVKFVEIDNLSKKSLSSTINNQTNLEKINLYIDNLKLNIINYYESSNMISTIITILFMVIKILYKNKDIK